MKQKKITIRSTVLVTVLYLLVSFVATGSAWAQGPHAGGPPLGGLGGQDMPPHNGPGGGPYYDHHSRPPGGPEAGGQSTMHGGLQLGPPGRWWDDMSFAGDIGLSAEQRKKMDAIFDESKGTLLNLYNGLRVQENGLERLTTGIHLEEEKIFLQIDEVTKARAALEKANAHMLLQIRNQMTDEQVERLDEHRPQHRPPEQ